MSATVPRLPGLGRRFLWIAAVKPSTAGLKGRRAHVRRDSSKRQVTATQALLWVTPSMQAECAAARRALLDASRRRGVASAVQMLAALHA